MRLKLATLVVLALAGGASSVALADHGHGDNHGPASCQRVHVRGTLAAGSLSVTPRAAKDATTTPTAVARAIPAGAVGEATACQTGTGAAATWTLREAVIHVHPAKPTSPTAGATTTTTSTTTP